MRAKGWLRSWSADQRAFKAVETRRRHLKIAFISDIHANIQGMQACIAHARARGAEQFAFLGDFVGYGANPGEVVDLARQMVAEGAWAIQGNHDEMALFPPLRARTLGETTAAWTHSQLNAAQLRFLRQLPMQRQEGHILLVHASVDHPADWRYVYDLDAAADSLDYASDLPGVQQVFVGHVHDQTLYRRDIDGVVGQIDRPPGVKHPLREGFHWLATVGSAGQPRDGNPQAMYSLLDTVKHALVFHRVDYDHLAAAQAIRSAGLPDWLARRLEMGR
jgi:diadenosine tetraphosphatase ApaH/serine/threonine PP2A family protein phosphatase